MRHPILVAIGACAVMAASPAVCAEAGGHITGIGGVFVTSKDPKALAKWYKEVLGIALEPWGGAIFRYDAPDHPPMAQPPMTHPPMTHPPMTLWNAMPETDEEIAPSRRDFMINFAVDDLDAFVARLKSKGVAILKIEGDKTGKFAWILDPDGTKIELWQPAKG